MRSVVFAIALFSTISTTSAFATVRLLWEAPTQNADGSPLTDLAGYKVKQSSISGNFSSAVETSVSSASTTLDLSNLSDGAYYFVVTAVDTSGNESAPSIEASYITSGAQIPNIPNDSDGDGISDLFFFNKTGYHGFQSIGSQDSIQSLTGNLGSGKYGTGDVDGDGITEILYVKTESKGLRWYYSTPGSTTKTSLGLFGGKKDLPLLGCQVNGKSLPVVLKTSGSRMKLAIKGKKEVTLKNKLSDVFCSRGKNSNLIAMISSNRKNYAVIVSAKGKESTKVLLPTGLKKPKLLVLPAFAESKERLTVIGTGKNGLDVYGKNRTKSKFDKIVLAERVGATSAAFAGVFGASGRFIGVSDSSIFKVLLVDSSPAAVQSLPYISIPKGYSLVR